LSKAKENARRTNCISNLRQWGLALQMYASDNNSGLPTDGFGADPHNNYVWCNPPGPSGTPDDPLAWFNLLPPYVSEKTLANYYDTMSNSRGINGNTKAAGDMPFPGGKGPMWECPSAYMSPSTIANILQPADGMTAPGQAGFFSYAMNIDLKRDPADQSGQKYYTFPKTSKITNFKQPSATVFMFDQVLDPVSEIVNGSPQFNSVNPADRWRSFASRHEKGGVINFLDGHVSYFKTAYVQNPLGADDSNERLNFDIIWNAPFRGAE
jgi:prepilin-type processing-associated H-X9-DG protein